ncbi:hypothetical protein FPV67DRAFT_1451378 [Lyophyllum atratum]|nr:hypothetical protein FPV67DRAFT_1451378 [Lyophyllum atratum]
MKNPQCMLLPLLEIDEVSQPGYEEMVAFILMAKIIRGGCRWAVKSIIGEVSHPGWVVIEATTVSDVESACQKVSNVYPQRIHVIASEDVSVWIKEPTLFTPRNQSWDQSQPVGTDKKSHGTCQQTRTLLALKKDKTAGMAGEAHRADPSWGRAARLSSAPAQTLAIPDDARRRPQTRRRPPRQAPSAAMSLFSRAATARPGHHHIPGPPPHLLTAASSPTTPTSPDRHDVKAPTPSDDAASVLFRALDLFLSHRRLNFNKNGAALKSRLDNGFVGLELVVFHDLNMPPNEMTIKILLKLKSGVVIRRFG